jgi:Uri superfamily endonuclease
MTQFPQGGIRIMKSGKSRTITIYDDQVSGERSEKKMRLIKRIIKEPEKEYWHVRFIDEQISSYRWIPTVSETEEEHLDP